MNKFILILVSIILLSACKEPQYKIGDCVAVIANNKQGTIIHVSGGTVPYSVRFYSKFKDQFYSIYMGEFELKPCDITKG